MGLGSEAPGSREDDLLFRIGNNGCGHCLSVHTHGSDGDSIVVVSLTLNGNSVSRPLPRNQYVFSDCPISSCIISIDVQFVGSG